MQFNWSKSSIAHTHTHTDWQYYLTRRLKLLKCVMMLFLESVLLYLVTVNYRYVAKLLGETMLYFVIFGANENNAQF
uniref:Uncharacterized protein n=1 Tax=Amphimedon queenslandica TaxID=400682 RepID=A0A1X7VMC1_AMPQE